MGQISLSEPAINEKYVQISCAVNFLLSVSSVDVISPNTKMIKEAAKVAVVLASSAVAIPYTVAFLANLLKGWPLGRDKYKRAFHPRKVYALNYALLQQLGNLKYTWLYFKWRSHYANCTSTRILKVLGSSLSGNKTSCPNFLW